MLEFMLFAAVLFYVVMEWAAIAVLLQGLFWFLVGCVLLGLLAIGYVLYSLLDIVLGWICDHVTESVFDADGEIGK